MLVLLWAIWLAAADIPLAVAKAPGSANQVELRNTGTQAINAWAFAVTSPNASGGLHREFHSADVYMSEATGGLQGAEPHLRALQPGESRVVPVDPIPANATMQAMAVVFEDNTAVGDEQTIASFFDKRAAERDELKRVVEIFNAVPVMVPPQRGAAVFADLTRRFAVGAGATESVAHRSARLAVESWQQRLTSATDDELARALRTYAAFVLRQLEVAAKHATRKS